jgi:hypothetical protein
MSSEENPNKPRELKITVDSEQMKQMAMDLAKSQLKISKLEEKTLDQQGETKRILFKDEGESKPLLFNSDSDLATRKIQVWEKFHDERFLSATTKEELSSMLTNYINEVAEKRKPAPSGSAPLQSDYQEFQKSGTYPSHKALVEDLYRREREGDVTAHQILNKLFDKHFREFKKQSQTPDKLLDPNSKEALEELNLIQKNGFLQPANPEDGDIGQYKRKYRERQQTKRKKVE